jgi:glycosyltransferase involved in cell wall biosynthesis
MRIGLVVAGGVARGGREHVVPALLWLVEALAKRHDVHVFVLDYYPDRCTYPLLGATVHDLGRTPGPRGLRRLRMVRRLATAVAAAAPFDVLHAYWAVPAGAATISVSRTLGIPAVVTLDSGELVRCDDIAYGLQRRWIDRRAVRTVTRRAAALTVTTQFMKGLAASHGANPDVIPLGVDAARFPLVGRIEGPPWRLIRVASINRVKDYTTLLEALAQLVRIIPGVHLDIVGEDTLGGAMQSLAASLALDEHVTFHGGLPTDRVSAMYSGAHLNVVSSRHEAANVSVLEAACTGLATVGTAVGFVADFAPDRAIAVPVQDAPALGQAIADLLRDHARREAVAHRARDWALAHDASWTAAQFEEVYARVATRR